MWKYMDVKSFLPTAVIFYIFNFREKIIKQEKKWPNDRSHNLSFLIMKEWRQLETENRQPKSDEWTNLKRRQHVTNLNIWFLSYWSNILARQLWKFGVEFAELYRAVELWVDKFEEKAEGDKFKY